MFRRSAGATGYGPLRIARISATTSPSVFVPESCQKSAELPVRVDAVVMFRPSLPGSAVYQLAHLLDPPPTASDLGPYAPQLPAQYR